jgi:hypothetical protein
MDELALLGLYSINKKHIKKKKKINKKLLTIWTAFIKKFTLNLYARISIYKV